MEMDGESINLILRLMKPSFDFDFGADHSRSRSPLRGHQSEFIEQSEQREQTYDPDDVLLTLPHLLWDRSSSHFVKSDGKGNPTDDVAAAEMLANFEADYDESSINDSVMRESDRSQSRSAPPVPSNAYEEPDGSRKRSESPMKAIRTPGNVGKRPPKRSRLSLGKEGGPKDALSA